MTTTRPRVETRSKLLKLKSWLTVAEAANHLSLLVDEEVTEADIFQFALVRRLTLSVRFVNPVTAMQLTPERTFERTDEDEWEVGPDEFPEHPFLVLPDGLYDLPMTGVERLDVEQEYQKRTGGPEVTIREGGDGPFVTSWITRARFRIQREAEQPNAVERSGRCLPPDAVFVVRPNALEEFMRQIYLENGGCPAPHPVAPTTPEPTGPIPDEPSDAPSRSDADQVPSDELVPLDMAGQDLKTKEGRRKAVKAFLDYCNRTQRFDLRQHHIWKALGYKSASQFQAWLGAKGKPRESAQCAERVQRILALSPKDFVSLLHRKKLLPDT